MFSYFLNASEEIDDPKNVAYLDDDEVVDLMVHGCLFHPDPVRVYSSAKCDNERMFTDGYDRYYRLGWLMKSFRHTKTQKEINDFVQIRERIVAQYAKDMA